MKLLAYIIFIFCLTAGFYAGLSLYVKRNIPITRDYRVYKPTIADINPAELSADKLFQIVNEWRVKEGYQQYEKSEFTCEISNQRLPEIKINFNHAGFSAERFCPKDLDCKIGENLVEGYNSEEEAFNSWLNSPTHRNNLESDYTHSCIKCDSGYCVHIFSYF